MMAWRWAFGISGVLAAACGPSANATATTAPTATATVSATATATASPTATADPPAPPDDARAENGAPLAAAIAWAAGGA